MSYVARFLCGRIPRGTGEDPNPQHPPLGPSTYRTMITVYNPGDSPVVVTKFTLKTGGMALPSCETIGPKQMLQINCTAIASAFNITIGGGTPLFNGFIEFTTSVSDVAAGTLPDPPKLHVMVPTRSTTSPVKGKKAVVVVVEEPEARRPARR